MLESKFQRDLVKEIRKKYPDAYVFKTDASQVQGFPDLLILKGNRWAALECKHSATAKHRPNQDFHVAKCNMMSFARFVWPENKKEVLDAMDRSFKGSSKR